MHLNKTIRIIKVRHRVFVFLVSNVNIMFFLIDDLDTLTLWKIILNMVTELPRRKKLTNVNTIEDVVRLISKYCISNHLWYDFIL